MKRKWLSLLLVLALLFGMMPAAVFADSGATASVRIVGANNKEFITYKAVPITDGVTTMEELTNKAVVTSGAAITLNGWGFVDTIDGCDIGSDYWMCMLNDSGDAFNTGDFTSVTAKDGDVLVLYPYGNGYYAWLNAIERANVDIMPWDDMSYITGTALFVLSATNWTDGDHVVEDAKISVLGEGGTTLGAYDYYLPADTTNSNGAVTVDFYGSCLTADLDSYENVYEVYASKDGINTAFCRVTLTKDGLTFSQPAGSVTKDDIPLEKPNVSYADLIAKIAASYAAKSSLGDWQIMEMSAYNTYDSNSPNKLSASVKQNYVNTAVSAATAASAPGEADIDKMVLALQAAGYDPQKLYKADSEDAVSLIEMLDGISHSTDAWTAPYTMAAYAQNSATKATGLEVAKAVLATQNTDGSFESYGSKVDATANMIAGLAFYADDADVKAAIEDAVDFLASAQKNNGTFDSWGYGPDANTAAIVVIGLCAAGVDPATDTRFVKEGFSALDGLLVYALADNSGFGYQDNATLNDSSTEQGFRALLAAANVAKTKKAFNIYDYSKNSPLEEAKATAESAPATPADPTGDDITVKVTVKPQEGYWLKNYSVTLPGDGATAYHALVKAFDENGMTYEANSVGYIKSVTYDGTKLAEFDGGPNSGWLYKVGSVLPTVGLSDYSIKDGDVITFYYTNDWTQDPDAAANAGLSGGETPAEEGETVFIDVKDSDWYDEYAYKAAEEGLFAGYAAGTDEEGNELYEFRGKDTMTRAMFVTVLRALNIRLNGETEEAPDTDFTDVPDGAWFEAAVNWAYANGLTAGKGEAFGVDDPVTREQMAVLLYGYAKMIGKVSGEPDLTKLDAFNDADQVSDYAKEAIAWLVGEGLMAGCGNDTLAPAESSTRAEVAAFMIGCLEYLK
ncbi:MAG: S-layer homology domain-containing protein [Firmicutes bacterium]|nr:S-layer homology domain-containing protein [Bacillota bacterium]